MSATYSAPALRDRFLEALGAPVDYSRAARSARDLIDSRNPLPQQACDDLGLPSSSTYGDAARCVLARALSVTGET
jgi:hypothetical protein